MRTKLRFGVIKVLNWITTKISEQKFTAPVKDLSEFKRLYGDVCYEDETHVRNVKKNNKKFESVYNFAPRKTLFSLWLAKKDNKTMRILDVGGGSSSIYYNLTQMELDIDIICLEPRNFIRTCGEKYRESLQYKLIEQSELVNYPCDVCFFGSSIQYQYDEQELSRLIKDSCATSIIVAGSIVCDHEINSLIYGQPKQSNGFQPYKVWSVSKLTSIMAEFDIHLKCDVPEEHLNFVLPLTKRKPFTRFLVYEKIRS